MIAKKSSGIRTLFPERPTLGMTGRRRAKRVGHPRAQLLGAPVDAVVGRLFA
jgi:hypothetical protein